MSETAAKKDEVHQALLLADFDGYDWQTFLAKKPSSWIVSSYAPLHAEAERLKKKGDEKGSRVFGFLGRIASWEPQYSEAGNPYDLPWLRSSSPTGELITKQELDILSGLLPQIEDADFRARVADLLWEFRKDYKAAIAAAEAFLQGAYAVEDGIDWPHFAERLERSFDLAARLGRGKKLHRKIQGEIEQLIAKYSTKPDSGLLCLRLMEMLLKHKAGDATKYATLSETLARTFDDNKQWDFANFYWELAAEWHRRAKDEDAARESRIRGAESWVCKAEHNLTDGRLGAGFSAHWIGAALETLRQAGARPERIEELHRRLRELQKLAMSELSPLQLSNSVVARYESAIEKVAEAARAHVSGHSFDEALFKLAFIRQPVDPKDVLQCVENESSQTVFRNLFPSTAVSSSGLTAEAMPPRPLTEGSALDDWRMQNAFLHARSFEWPTEVEAFIEPARQEFIKEHSADLSALSGVVYANPFVPQGREKIFARGLAAGLNNDWLIATHLLIPQLEAAIRSLLNRVGIVTSNLESDATQEERQLGWLLYHEQMEKTFGAACTFNLRALLVERFGANLRNDMAHGLLPESAFSTPATVYFWWLVLRLCCSGHQMSLADGPG
jgi:hypothetical protein